MLASHNDTQIDFQPTSTATEEDLNQLLVCECKAVSDEARMNIKIAYDLYLKTLYAPQDRRMLIPTNGRNREINGRTN